MGIFLFRCGAQAKLVLAPKGRIAFSPWETPSPLMSPENANFAFSGVIGIFIPNSIKPRMSLT